MIGARRIDCSFRGDKKSRVQEFRIIEPGMRKNITDIKSLNTRHTAELINSCEDMGVLDYWYSAEQENGPRKTVLQQLEKRKKVLQDG